MESRVLGGDRVPAMVTAQAEVMPALGQYGIVADLDAVTRLSTSWPVDISYQVWAGPGTPGPEVVRMALGEAGIQVLAMRSLRARAKDLARQGPALALLLLLGVAASGMVVAALATLASALVQARRRAYEMAALRTAGIRNAELQGATLREYLVLLGVGSLCGFGSGISTALLAGPHVAVLGTLGPVAPTATRLPLPLVATVAISTLLMFLVISLACARLTLRFARPDVLRGGPA